MYEPTHLRTFLSVAQTLSFTQAARRLGLRQSTVSQHVRRLRRPPGGSCSRGTPTPWS